MSAARMQPLSAAANPKSLGRNRAWAVVAVLFLIQVVNYADKTVVSIAANDIMAEFRLTPAQYGIVTGAFFSLYAVSGLLVAFYAAPRFRPRKIMMALLIAWSIVQLPIVFAASFPMIVLCRVLLGMGEGAGTPTALNASHEWFDSRSRNMPSAAVLFGSTAGALIAAPALTAIIQLFEWRAAFLACGVLGIGVLLLWAWVSGDGPHASPVSSAQAGETSVGSAHLWRDPTMWGIIIAGSAAYWLAGFMIGWLAPFVRTLVGDAERTAWLLSIIYATQAALVLGVAFLSQRLLLRGVTSRRARGWMMSGCLSGAGFAFLGVAMVDGIEAKLILTAIGIGLPAPIFPLSAAMISEVAPPAQRNRAMTIILSVVTLAAVPASILTGTVVGASSEGWAYALSLHGIVALAGGVCAFFLLHPERSMANLQTMSPTSTAFSGEAA